MTKWLIAIGVFISLVVVFKLIDGTILEPRLNNIGHFMMRIVGGKLDWFTLYHSPFLKFVTILFALIIIVMVIKDIVVLFIYCSYVYGVYLIKRSFVIIIVYSVWFFI